MFGAKVLKKPILSSWDALAATTASGHGGTATFEQFRVLYLDRRPCLIAGRGAGADGLRWTMLPVYPREG